MLSLMFGIDRAVLRIDGEQHRAFEAVVLGENFGQLRQGFFGAVLFVAADEHDAFARGGPWAGLEHNPRIGRRGRSGQGGESNEGEDRADGEWFGKLHVWASGDRQQGGGSRVPDILNHPARLEVSMAARFWPFSPRRARG